MIWLPTPLKGFTDALPEVKTMLRICAFNLYGWVCDHPSVSEQADAIRGGELPANYPETWPSPARPGILPRGTSPFTDAIEREIAKRKSGWRASLAHASFPSYPRDQVREVLEFWKISL